MRIRDYGILNGDQTPPDEIGGTHPYQELLYVRDGQAELAWLGYRWTVGGPALFLLPSGTPHWLKVLDGRCKLLYAELELAGGEEEFPAMQELVRWNALQASAQMTSSGAACLLWESLDHFFRLLQLEAANDSPLLSQVREADLRKLLLLVRHIMDDSVRQSPHGKRTGRAGSPPADLTRNIMRYMESRYSRPLTLDMLAGAFHLDRSYLVRVFRQEAGMTPFAYLGKLRLEAAAHYLASTPLSVTEVADRTGFRSLHYFSRAFKRAYGVSPSSWKEQRGTGAR